jgi:hypothetical protein
VLPLLEDLDQCGIGQPKTLEQKTGKAPKDGSGLLARSDPCQPEQNLSQNGYGRTSLAQSEHNTMEKNVCLYRFLKKKTLKFTWFSMLHAQNTRKSRAKIKIRLKTVINKLPIPEHKKTATTYLRGVWIIYMIALICLALILQA